MKRKLISLLILVLTCFTFESVAQSMDDMLNLMIGKGLIKQEEADSIRAEAAIRAQNSREKQKSYSLFATRYMQFSGYIQTRFQSNQQKGVTDGLDIRRARLEVRGDVLPTWEYRLQVDFAGSPKILDAYAVFKPFDFLKFQAGQFKLPFSADNLMSSAKLEFIDRSQVTEALVSRGKDVLGNNNGRDIGGVIFGSFLKHQDRFIIDYYLGGFNGQGINVTEKNESKDVVGRLVLHPVKGFDIGGGYYNGWDFLIMKPDTGNFIRHRLVCEMAYSWKWLTLKGEYINGQDGSIRREGFFIQSGFFVWPKKLQLLAKYDQFDPDLKKGGDASRFYIGGFNFFFNEWAKIGLNYSFKNEEKGEEKKINNDLIAIQLQIGF